MTVIAFDGKTLAADKRANDENNHYAITKIFRHRDLIFGFSGSVDRGIAMRQWVICGCKLDDFPASQSSDDFVELIVINKPKRGSPIIMLYEQTPFPLQVEQPFHAIGSGRDFALAAMHLGKSAKEAVEIACLFSRECGNGIDTLTF